MGAGYFLAPALLSMMNTPESMMADSVTYLRIFFLGILFTFIYNIGSSILRSVGDSKRPLYYLIVCCFLNIGLDLLFVLVFHMGIAGAAIGSSLAEMVSVIFFIIYTWKRIDCKKYALNILPKFMENTETHTECFCVDNDSELCFLCLPGLCSFYLWSIWENGRWRLPTLSVTCRGYRL